MTQKNKEKLERKEKRYPPIHKPMIEAGKQERLRKQQKKHKQKDECASDD